MRVRILSAALLNEQMKPRKSFLPSFGEAPLTLMEVYDKQYLIYLPRPLPKLMWEDMSGVGEVGGSQIDLQGDFGRVNSAHR
jgi:hypothetical protein